MKIKKVLFSQGKKFYWKGGDLHTQFGLVIEKDILTKSKVYSNKGKEFMVLPASFLDNLEKIKQGPQIMTPKDIGEIITRTGINKSSKVLEIGTGSGVLTSFLARIAKEITSYEIRKDHKKIAEKNLNDLEINNVKIINKDASKEIKEKNFDVATIDIKEPWTVLENVAKALRPGGYIASYSPSLTQSDLVIKQVKQNSNLKVLKTIETIERSWDIKKQIMHPEPRMIGHTAFITFLRKV